MNETKNLEGDVSPLASIDLLDAALTLKTCPFCDNKAILKSNFSYETSWYWVECSKCESRTASEEVIRLAVRHWNCRVSQKSI